MRTHDTVGFVKWRTVRRSPTGRRVQGGRLVQPVQRTMHLRHTVIGLSGRDGRPGVQGRRRRRLHRKKDKLTTKDDALTGQRAPSGGRTLTQCPRKCALWFESPRDIARWSMRPGSVTSRHAGTAACSGTRRRRKKRACNRAPIAARNWPPVTHVRTRIPASRQRLRAWPHAASKTARWIRSPCAVSHSSSACPRRRCVTPSSGSLALHRRNTRGRSAC